jgi:hypothetical protein
VGGVKGKFVHNFVDNSYTKEVKKAFAQLPAVIRSSSKRIDQGVILASVNRTTGGSVDRTCMSRSNAKIADYIR